MATKGEPFGAIAAAAERLEAAGYEVKRGVSLGQGFWAPGPTFRARNGNLVATATPMYDGRASVALRIDYGADGDNYCDSAELKSSGGIARKAIGFLGAPKEAK